MIHGTFTSKEDFSFCSNLGITFVLTENLEEVKENLHCKQGRYMYIYVPYIVDMFTLFSSFENVYNIPYLKKIVDMLKTTTQGRLLFLVAVKYCQEMLFSTG